MSLENPSETPMTIVPRDLRPHWPSEFAVVRVLFLLQIPGRVKCSICMSRHTQRNLSPIKSKPCD